MRPIVQIEASAIGVEADGYYWRVINANSGIVWHSGQCRTVANCWHDINRALEHCPSWNKD